MGKTRKFDGKTYTLHKTIGGRNGSLRARNAVTSAIRKGLYVRVVESKPKSAGRYIFKIWVRKPKKGDRKSSPKRRKFSGRYL